MLQMIVRKGGKQVQKLWISHSEIERLLKKFDAEEIAFRVPDVEVLDLQSKEAKGLKDE